MEVRLKHNEFRDLVNELRDTADRYGGTDQLRDQLAHTLARRVRPVPDIVKMRPVLERIDARLACDVLSASSTVEVLKLARDEIMVLADEVMELRAALQHEADCVEAAKAEVEVLRAELVGLRSSMEFRTSLIGRTEAERDALRAELDALKAALNKIADGYYKSFEQHEVALRMQEIARKALTAAPKPEESK